MPLRDIIEQINAWPFKKKIALISIVILSFVIMVGIMLWSQKIDYRVLYSNLTVEDASEIVNTLRGMAVPYKVVGNIIYVPKNMVYSLRLDLAAQGIPLGGGVGFEIFDKTQIGITEFVQRVNYMRALQGELARTIRQLTEVEQARVHIAIPERTIFTEKEEEPTASVLLSLRHGRTLNQGQVNSILHLVASSIEGMHPQNVTILDNRGRLLSEPANANMIVDTEQLELQRSVNEEYENRIQSMLESIVGRGNVIVRVAAEIDFTRVEKTEERFDPDTIAIRREQRTTEEFIGAQPAGIPGVLANQPGGPVGAAGAAVSSQMQSEVIDYEISRSVSRIIQPMGRVKSVSVAVIVNETYRIEDGEKMFIPRQEDEMRKYREIVMAAIGYYEGVGSQVTVKSMPFELPTPEEFIPEEIDFLEIAMSLLKYIVPLLAMVFFIVFVVRPIIKVLKSPTIKRIPTGESAPAAQVTKAAPELSEGVMKEAVLGTVKKDPRHASMIVKEWLAE